MSLLELKDVRIAYGGVEAVHGISLAVERGRIATILGTTAITQS
ncbi:MAG TPA: ABC transporter ATP-binding protein, partial [Firmicutes bacterium]|nr:ABC transporter ATP-binding protein [Bacillota bacterium]